MQVVWMKLICGDEVMAHLVRETEDGYLVTNIFTLTMQTTKSVGGESYRGSYLYPFFPSFAREETDEAIVINHDDVMFIRNANEEGIEHFEEVLSHYNEDQVYSRSYEVN